MLEIVFLQILNMSFAASVVIVFVLGARVLLKKAPKIFSYALWGVVLFRLICPFSFEIIYSLIPVNLAPISQDILYSEVPEINTGIDIVDRAVNASLPPAASHASVNPMQILTVLGASLWICGIAVLLIYSIISLARLKAQLKNATHKLDNIYLSGYIHTPFVMGIVNPKIYLPSSFESTEMEYILLHEQIHIKRFDHVLKALSFLVLCIHWFNPLVWAAFFLSGKDLEMSCDEAVLKQLGNDVKKDYSSSLLALATGRRIIGGTPLAFGERDTKGRIKNVLRYKKPAFWIFVVVLVAVAVLAISLMGNPVSGGFVRRYPEEYFFNSSNKDYSAIKIKDNQGKDITGIVIDLWWAANEVYNVDDTAMFEMGEGIYLLENAPEFYELKNYDTVVNSIFTPNARAQLEQTRLGSETTTFLQRKDGKVYRLGSWKTGYSYAGVLVDMQPKEVVDRKITMTVKYETNARFYAGEEEGMDYVPEYDFVDFTIVKTAGTWMVEDYIFPDALREATGATYLQSRAIASWIGTADIEYESITDSTNPLIEGMDANFKAFDLIGKDGNTYLLILRKEDNDFTAVLNSDGEVLHGIIDNGVLPAYFVERGVAGDSPTDVVGALLERYKTEGDFMELCSPKLDEIAVREVMDKMIDPDWQYFISEENPEDFGVSIGENEYMVLFAGGESEKTDEGTIIHATHEAYAIVTTDTKTSNYVISQLNKLSRFDN